MLFERIILPHIGYYDGKLFAFINKSGTVQLTPADENTNPIVTIIARSKYSEHLKSVPIEERKQVIQLLKIEKGHGNDSVYDVTSTEEGKTFFNEWQFEHVPFKTNFLIPETAIIAGSSEKNTVVTIKDDSELYVASGRRGINSSYQTAFIKNESHFKASIGQGETNSQHICFDGNYSRLVRSLFTIPVGQWWIFFRRNSVSIEKQKLVSWLKSFSCLITSYFVVSSIYLIGNTAYLEYQLDKQEVGVSSALSLQGEVDGKMQMYNSFKQLEAQFHSHSDIWLIMASLFRDVEVSNIRFQNSRYILRGQADKATDILEQLLNVKNIEDAQFDFPTRKSRNKEVFVLSFRIGEVN
ncbi:hypothetical protein J8L97_03785 [Pseudoalteromonas sp. MMG012]|nr:hypothetical protein [Pseudoalteromonas sp. MMG012]